MKLDSYEVMISADIRGRPDIPFGGLQIVCTGDLFQLPPVSRDSQPSFCFESESWKQTVHKCIEMKQVFRQSNPEFIEVLNDARFGSVTDRLVRMLASAKDNDVKGLSEQDGIWPTLLFSVNEKVDRINQEQLEMLPGIVVNYEAIDFGGRMSQADKEFLFSGFLAARELQLKKNAQVLLVKNLSKTLVNGSRGIIVDFVESTSTDDSPWKLLPVVRFANGEIKTITPETFTIHTGTGILGRTQIPLKLAYAMVCMSFVLLIF